METMKLVLPLNEEMTAIRRHIHQHPELSNEEFETTKLIREKLKSIEVELEAPKDFTSPDVLYEDLVKSIRKYHPSDDLGMVKSAGASSSTSMLFSFS